MNVFIPDSMKQWVEQQANSDRCDQERSAKIARIQALVTEGIESGIGHLTMAELKAAARR